MYIGIEDYLNLESSIQSCLKNLFLVIRTSTVVRYTVSARLSRFVLNRSAIHPKMSGKYVFAKSLKELRFLFCQTSDHSAAARLSDST